MNSSRVQSTYRMSRFEIKEIRELSISNQLELQTKERKPALPYEFRHVVERLGQSSISAISSDYKDQTF